MIGKRDYRKTHRESVADRHRRMRVRIFLALRSLAFQIQGDIQMNKRGQHICGRQKTD